MKESANGALNQEVDISRTGDRDSVRLLEDLEDLEDWRLGEWGEIHSIIHNAIYMLNTDHNDISY